MPEVCGKVVSEEFIEYRSNRPVKVLLVHEAVTICGFRRFFTTCEGGYSRSVALILVLSGIYRKLVNDNWVSEDPVDKFFTIICEEAFYERKNCTIEGPLNLREAEQLFKQYFKQLASKLI